MHLKLFPLLCCAGPDVHYTNLFVCVFVFLCFCVFVSWCFPPAILCWNWWTLWKFVRCLCVVWCFFVLFFECLDVFPLCVGPDEQYKSLFVFPLPGTTSVAAVHQSQYKIQCNKVQRGKKYKSRENATYTLQQYTQIFGTIDWDKNNKTIV